jgi:hypothetical protein
VMFSSDAAHNVHEHFPLRGHLYPPSYELSADTVIKKAFSLDRIVHFTTRKSNGSTYAAVLGQQQAYAPSREALCSSGSRQDSLAMVVRGGRESASGTVPRSLVLSHSDGG